jgi:acetyltransferase-like isoleucine patch superfamily enzyme
MSIREYLKLHPKALRLVATLYNLLHRNNCFRGFKSNRVVCHGAFFDHSYIHINGTNCSVEIEPMARLHHCNIYICGNNCSFRLGGAHTIVSNTSFVIEDDCGSISIGKDFTMEGGEIAATEGEAITIGKDCMFSSDVELRNGDSHVILVKETGKRTNYAKPITIGNHVWLTAHVRVLKGSVVPDESIIGNSSVVSGKFYTPNAVLAGNPAKQVKTGITWNRFRDKYIKDSNGK